MKSILVVDDDEYIRIMLKKLFEQEGYAVQSAENGKTAVKSIYEKPVDIVITDIIMPEKEGLETIMELRRDFPGLEIIAISGGGLIHANEYLKLAKVMGARYTFSKPLSIAELKAAVRSLLEPCPKTQEI
jgi:DNA-binding response OmpR family regulator